MKRKFYSFMLFVAFSSLTSICLQHIVFSLQKVNVYPNALMFEMCITSMVMVFSMFYAASAFMTLFTDGTEQSLETKLPTPKFFPVRLFIGLVPGFMMGIANTSERETMIFMGPIYFSYKIKERKANVM